MTVDELCAVLARLRPDFREVRRELKERRYFSRPGELRRRKHYAAVLRMKGAQRSRISG